MENRELQILLTIRDEMSSKFEAINKKLDGARKQADKSSLSFGKLAKAVGATALAWKAFDFLKQSLNEFAKLEATQTRLATIVNNATGATREQVQALFDQAEALERIGVVDKEVIMQGQAKLATFDLTSDAIQKLTPQLLDMAVAEYGVAVTSEQVANLANGMGKALQGNTELLSKMGFKLTDSEKQLLETGNETQRLATMNQILGRTYDDVNAKMALTTEGQMKRMSFMVGNLKEGIGRGLTVALGEFVEEINVAGGALNNTGNQFEGFAKTMYSLTHLILGLGNAMSMTFTGVKQFGSGVGKGLAQGFKTTFEATKGLLTGNFKEAYQEIITSSQQTSARFAEDTIKNADKASKAWGNLKRNLDEASNLKGFKMPEFNFFGGKGGGENEIEKGAEKVSSELSKLSDHYKDFSDDVDETLFDLAQSHREKMAGFAKDLDNVRAEMAKTQAEFQKGQASDRMGVAEEVLANEERIAEIQAQLSGEVEKKKRRELEAELANRILATQQNSDFISSIQAEVDEARRRAGLTDLERAIEDFNIKRTLAQQEFDERMGQLRAEMSEIKSKREEEKTLYSEKVAFIKEMQDLADEQHQTSLTNQLSMTKEAIDKEIEYYKMLAEAIAGARKGNTAEVARVQTKFKSVNDAIITPKGDIISTHPEDYIIATKKPQNLGGGGPVINITGNTLLSEDVARQIGNQIISRLKMQRQL